MFKFLALTSTLVLASAVFTGLVAQAQDAILFGNIQPGTAQTTGGVLATGIETQTTAIIPLQTQQPGIIQISAPVLISGPTSDPSGSSLISLLSFDGSTIQSNISGGVATLTEGNRNLQVGLQVRRPEAYPAASQPYVYRVTIAATINGNIQTKEVDFAVTIIPACNFTNSSNGELQMHQNNLNELQTKTSAQVDLQCNAPAELQVNSPTIVSSPANLNNASLNATATLAGTTVNSSESSAQVFGATGGSGKVVISMQVSNNSTPLPPGNYKFNVTLTAAPQ